MGILSNNVGQADISRLSPGQEVSIRYKKKMGKYNVIESYFHHALDCIHRIICWRCVWDSDNSEYFRLLDTKSKLPLQKNTEFVQALAVLVQVWLQQLRLILLAVHLQVYQAVL